MAGDKPTRSLLPRLASSPPAARDYYDMKEPSGSGSTNAGKRKAADDQNFNPNPAKVPAIATTGSSQPPIRTSRIGPSANTRRTAVQSLTVPMTRKPLAESQVGVAGRRAVSASAGVKKASGMLGNRRTTPDPGVRGAVTRSAANGRSGPALSQEARLQRMEEQLGEMGEDRAQIAADMAAERAKVASLETFRENLQTELNSTKTMELETRRNLLAAADENEALKKRHAREIADLEMNLSRKDRECRELRDEIDGLRRDLRAERDTVSALKTTLSTQSTTHLHLNSQMAALQGQRTTLQAQIEEHIGEAAQLRLQLQTERERVGQLEREAMEQETVRRKLHNLVQELKGNIRVFCRVRPPLAGERDLPDGLASITFPDKDGREIVLSSTTESATGAVREEVIPFTFDKVFQPHSTQEDVFEEISHLAQSCIDGYNVCIFAYGQTGSGKSFTMEGGSTDATRGMIPRAVHQVFAVAEHLRSKGWEYTMEGQFLEIYNETINDLLGTGDLDKKKHDIKHDKNGRTTVSDVVTIPLESPSQVRALLARAQSHRTVHATLMNERSSRSHSVFTLRISGKNPLTSESCEGSLNLVDLAGSERLNSSGAASDKDRLRETQAINKSLSALGDVIAALGEKAGSAGNNSHVPYRNSKLTYLLQNSLSGNSKTLMVLNLSPLAAHQGESLCSLRFATKVNNTTIGTARKQVQKPS